MKAFPLIVVAIVIALGIWFFKWLWLALNICTIGWLGYQAFRGWRWLNRRRNA